MKFEDLLPGRFKISDQIRFSTGCMAFIQYLFLNRQQRREHNIEATFNRDKRLSKIKFPGRSGDRPLSIIGCSSFEYRHNQLFFIHREKIYETGVREGEKKNPSEQHNRYVKLATMLGTNEVFAIKIIHKRIKSSDEISIQSFISHAIEKHTNEYNITRMHYPETYSATTLRAKEDSHGSYVVDLKSYLITPYFEKIKHLPNKLDSWLPIFIQLSNELESIHSNNCLHRDIKTDNIIITKAGAKIIDFDLAVKSKINISKTYSFHDLCVKGTYGFIAPEIFKKKSYSIQSDSFALGITLLLYMKGLSTWVDEYSFKVGKFDDLKITFKLFCSEFGEDKEAASRTKVLVNKLWPEVHDFPFFIKQAKFLIYILLSKKSYYSADNITLGNAAYSLAKVLLVQSYILSKMTTKDVSSRAAPSEIKDFFIQVDKIPKIIIKPMPFIWTLDFLVRNFKCAIDKFKLRGHKFIYLHTLVETLIRSIIDENQFHFYQVRNKYVSYVVSADKKIKGFNGCFNTDSSLGKPIISMSILNQTPEERGGTEGLFNHYVQAAQYRYNESEVNKISNPDFEKRGLLLFLGHAEFILSSCSKPKKHHRYFENFMYFLDELQTITIENKNSHDSRKRTSR